MGFYRSVRAVTGASGTGPVDWVAVTSAAKAATDPGSLSLSSEEEAGYAADVRDARARVREVSTIDFDVPETIEVQNRHHWIEANVDTFERIMAPIEQQATLLPDLARMANTGSMTVALSFLARNVLGQYDPLLLADGDEHALYFVHPNLVRVAEELDVDVARFRRWIAFHEVTHAAEFGAAPWLSDHLEETMEETVENLTDGKLDREGFQELDATMTAVEGYAELIMDQAFDQEFADLRRKLDQRRGGRGPISKLIRRLLGLGMKRRQYERGKAFFEHVMNERDVAAASLVWEKPENLPSQEELDEPAKWVARVA
jgi:uncharacterized protein (DUF2342 family)